MVPLLASIVVGLWGSKMPRAASHWITILAVAVVVRRVGRRSSATCMAGHTFNGDVYTWVAVGDAQDGDRLPDRPADRADADRRHVRVADGARLHDRLHGRRRRLFALLLLHLPVHVLDAHAGHEQQLPAALLRLGSGRPRLVPADRLLVHAADGDLRQPQGVPRQPRRRLRLHPGHRPRARVLRLDGLRAGVRQGAGARRTTTINLWGARRVVAA